MRRLRRAQQRHARQGRIFKRRAVAAGTAAIVTLGAAAKSNKALAAVPGYTPDKHELLVSQDADWDLLADNEETAIGCHPFSPDQNRNEIPDGVDLAKRCAAVFDQLPDCSEAHPNQLCKGFAETWGSETCDICGEIVNMGGAWVTNPRLDLTVNFPILAIHYLEHGSFSYTGDVHNGRIDVAELAAALELQLPFDPNDHQLPVAEDTDGDLLADKEEMSVCYRALEPDQNGNQVLDGVELAKRCAADINDLPWQNDALPGETYKWWAAQLGLETCDICGAQIGMGPGGIVNPRLKTSIEFPFQMGMHYMEHGSFSYAAHYGDDPVSGRIEVPALVRALELPLPCGPNEHQLPVTKDADADLLANKEETAIGYRPFKPDQNRNVIADGVELAQRCAVVVRALPSYSPWSSIHPPFDKPYKVEHALDGLEQCDICGQWIHMGGWEIINPKLGVRYPDSEDPLDRMFLPDLALHYMEHGSFDCYGDVHKGRVDIPLLLRVLELRYPYDPNEHQLPVDGNDLDEDLLTDNEELAASYNLYDPDQDEDLTPDGIELAKQCAEVIDALPVREPDTPGVNEPYKANFMQRGIESCDICGGTVNMGYWKIINPKLDLSIEVPDIVCHYMQHGSFSYSGDVHGKGRIDVPLLAKILEMPRRCGDLGTIYLPGDLNEDCKVDLADLAELAEKWLNNTDPSQQ